MKRKRIYYFLLIVLLVGSLTGCGEGNFEDPQHYSPISPLPLRVDATVVPDESPTPSSAKQNIQGQQDLSAAEIDQEASPTPTAQPSPILTPTPVPTANSAIPTPSSEPESVKPTATPSPVSETPTPKPTATPKTTIKPSQDIAIETAEEEDEDEDDEDELEDLSDQENLLDQQEDILKKAEQTITAQKTEKFQPIVTPDGMIIEKIAICAKVVNREGLNCGDTFSVAEVSRIYTWMRVSEITPPNTLKHLYYWKGTLISTVKLNLAHSSMRTWSQKTFNPLSALGKWKVVITTKENELLAVKEFTVVK